MTAAPVGPLALAAGWVAEQMGGAIVSGDASRVFANVSIDTRTLAAGDLFVAIRGENFDGEAFAAAAIEKGAAGVVLARGNAGLKPRITSVSPATSVSPGTSVRPAPSVSPAPSVAQAFSPARDVVVIEVEDTTDALQKLGRAIRRASGAKVVAITGSAGKTTTKEVTGELLAGRYRVIRNRGNLNNHIGLPLSLIELRQRPEIAIVELGMNHAGEISTLTRIAEPDVRVWTNVGEAHLGFFASQDAIADAKAEILEGADASSVLVANADDPRIAARTGAFRGRVVTFGIDRDADVRARDVRDLGIDGVDARIATTRGDVTVHSPLVGRANLANLLAATAVALEFDVPLDAIRDRVSGLAPAAHRGEVVKLRDRVTVIDDSYNANPTATKKAIDVLAASPAVRRIAVLGEMLELGDHAVALHEDVGRAAADAKLDLLFAVGGEPARALAGAAIKAGMPGAAVSYVATSDEAADAVVAAVESGDLVLVKGSRGVKTDRVVDRLKAERAERG